MRKISAYFGVIAAAALTLVSCAKEANDPNYKEEIIKEGIPFEIVANPATKTTIDGLQTQWAADDEINLLHAVAGSTTYVDDGKFTTESAGTSVTFTGTLASELASGTYDWYAVYPYNSYLHTVDNNPASPARFYIGKRSDQAQEQTGNSSTAHLCGTNYPLFGKAAGVAYDETPSVTLSPIASFIEIKVTNKTDDPLTVTSVSFTAPEGSEIVGQYEIHFDTTPLTITKYSTYVSDVANLTVTDGTPIAKDAYATFYIGVKPFSTTSGDDIKVAVNGYEKTIHTTKDFAFQAGKMKTVNFDYDNALEPEKTYTLYTGSMEEGDYLIVAGDKAMKAAVSSNRFSMADVTIVSNSISTSDASIVWHIAQSGEYWTFYNVAANKYAGGNGTKNQGALLTDATSNGAKWTVTNSETPSIVNYGNTLATVNATLRRNANYGFACYGSGTGTAPVFYKLSVTLASPELSWSDTEGLAEITSMGVDYALPSLINPHSVTISSYESTNTDVATVAADGTVTAVAAGTTTIKAIFDGDATYKPSMVSYELEVTDVRPSCATPAFTVAEGNVAAGTQVGITCETDGAAIHYTLDGTDPTEASPTYSALLTIDVTTTVKAIAVKSGYKPSAIATATYTIAGAATYTITWNSTNNSKGVSSYTSSWSVTASGITCNMTNWNNNNNGWSYVKCGSKNATSVATIVTDSAIPEAIKTVTLTIDALSASDINSIKLYVSDSTTFGEAEGEFAKETGDQSVVIASPAANKYYKIEVDCKKAASNGPLTLSKLVLTTN